MEAQSERWWGGRAPWAELTGAFGRAVSGALAGARAAALVVVLAGALAACASAPAPQIVRSWDQGGVALGWTAHHGPREAPTLHGLVRLDDDGPTTLLPAKHETLLVLATGDILARPHGDPTLRRFALEGRGEDLEVRGGEPIAWQSLYTPTAYAFAAAPLRPEPRTVVVRAPTPRERLAASLTGKPWPKGASVGVLGPRAEVAAVFHHVAQRPAQLGALSWLAVETPDGAIEHLLIDRAGEVVLRADGPIALYATDGAELALPVVLAKDDLVRPILPDGRVYDEPLLRGATLQRGDIASMDGRTTEPRADERLPPVGWWLHYEGPGGRTRLGWASLDLGRSTGPTWAECESATVLAPRLIRKGNMLLQRQGAVREVDVVLARIAGEGGGWQVYHREDEESALGLTAVLREPAPSREDLLARAPGALGEALEPWETRAYEQEVQRLLENTPRRRANGAAEPPQATR